MFDQMKPACAINTLHSRQGQSLGEQVLMKCLNLVNDSQCLISSGSRSHILDFVAKHLID